MLKSYQDKLGTCNATPTAMPKMLELKDGSHDKFMIQAVILVKKKNRKGGGMMVMTDIVAT